MAKTLKIWNGRGHGSKYGKGHAYVAAYSRAEACRLLSTAFNANISDSEVKTYYSEGAWGNTMNGIEPIEPCVYVTLTPFGDKPIRLI